MHRVGGGTPHRKPSSALHPAPGGRMSRRGRVVGSSPGMRRAALLVVVAVVAALWSVAASGDPAGGADGGASVAAVPVSSGSHSAALAFADTEFSVLPMSNLLGIGSRPGGAPGFPGATAGSVPSWRQVYFGELEMEDRSGTDRDLAFAVEGQPDRSLYEFCRRGSSTCHEVQVRATKQGLLYLWNPDPANFGTLHWSAAFPQQRLEVSASDAETGLKVYREVLVNPPAQEPGCEDYGDFTVEAYVCLFRRELIPEGITGSADEASLRAGLPELVQDASNYELVFAEEFDGTPPPANAAGCSDGLSTLDDSVWNYVDACGWVDSRGEPCNNVADGSLVAASTYKCGTNFNTFGKLHYKYGYLEFKYTLNWDAWGHDNNYNVVAWAPAYPEQHLWSQYGVKINDWEDYLKNASVELDFLEYVPRSRHSSWGMHANWIHSISSQLPAHRTGRRIDYCTATHAPENRPYWLFLVNNKLPCSSTDTFTITLGVEWTPRGYRSFVSWDGVQNELTVWPKHKIEVWAANSQGGAVLLSGTARDPYFEYVDPDDLSTILEQVGIGHSPNPIGVGAFGDGNWPSSSNYIRTRLKVDYIRLWQPTNHYSDMEPVYQ